MPDRKLINKEDLYKFFDERANQLKEKTLKEAMAAFDMAESTTETYYYQWKRQYCHMSSKNSKTSKKKRELKASVTLFDKQIIPELNAEAEETIEKTSKVVAQLEAAPVGQNENCISEAVITQKINIQPISAKGEIGNYMIGTHYATLKGFQTPIKLTEEFLAECRAVMEMQQKIFK
jgi:hypothetical protein